MLPIISIVIPTYNEEKHILDCLESIYTQDYPKNKLQVIIVDNHSKDNTLSLAKQYPVEVYKSTVMNSLFSKMIGLRKSKGEYFMYMDADNRYTQRDWIKTMLRPHKENEELVGSFTDIVPNKRDPILSQYLASFSFYSSPLFKFFSIPVEKTITEKKKGYVLCRYEENRIPPTGSCLYNIKVLKKARIDREEKFMDLDVLSLLVKRGYTLFAYNKTLGLYHTHMTSISQVYPKRKRNLDRNYIADLTKRHFTWVNFSNKLDVLKIALYIFYSYSLVFPFLVGIKKSFEHKRLFFVYLEPLVTVIETTAVIVAVIQNSQRNNFFRKILFAK